MGVLGQPVMVGVRGGEPPVLAGQQGRQQGAQPGLVGVGVEHLLGGPSGQRRLGERHPGAAGRGAALPQPLLVPRRQVVAGGQHPLVVHHVGQLSVGAGELQRQRDLLPGQAGVAVPQADRDEVGVPLPQRDVPQLGRHHRPGVAGHPQMDDVRPQHPPAVVGHRLQIGTHPRTPGEPLRPGGPRALKVGLVAGGLGDRKARTAPGEAPSGAQPVPAGLAGRRLVGHRQLRVAAHAERVRAAEAERRRPAGELDPVRQRRTDRQRTPSRVHHGQPAQQQAVGDPPLVLRGGHLEPAGLPGQHQQPGARRGERDLGQVELQPFGVDQCGHRPPRPELAIEPMILRWPITKAISIGIVAIAEAAITRP